MTGIRYPRALACGDTGISIEFGDCIDEAINARVLALDAAFERSQVVGVIETVPTYRSLMIHYDPTIFEFDQITALALTFAEEVTTACHPRRLLRIPVFYGDEKGIDIGYVAEAAGLSIDEFVLKHTASEYRVYMIGFQPGYTYLGGLDPALATPRRVDPRLNAPAGTISIGGSQCAIHSVAGPSGWHWIGRVALPPYKPDEPQNLLIQPGDAIKFEAVDRNQFLNLERDAIAGKFSFEVEVACHR
jgi:5-oxoprolinase (ATP-hydrolysing) subunit B